MELQHNTVREENKLLLRGITKHFPKPYKYAKRIVERLGEKGVIVTATQVYTCVGGDTYNADIAKEINQLGKEYLAEQIALRDAMKVVNAGLEEVFA